MSSRLGLIALTLLAASCNRPDQNSKPQNGETGVTTGEPGGTTIAKKKPTYTGTEGGKCKVVAGSNKGNKGKYNSDGDCSGGWGITECKEQDGKDSGKCKDAALTSVVTGDHLSIANVTVLNDAGEPVNCTVLLPDSGAASPKCQPAALDTIEDLKSSDDELDRRVAEALAPMLKSPGGK